MKKLFQAIKMVGKSWGVFLVNPNDPKDRYLLTSPLDMESVAVQFAADFNRIAEEAAKVDVPASMQTPYARKTTGRKFR